MPIFKKKKEAQQRGSVSDAKNPSVAFVCLGCPKNQVNAERMMAELLAAGMKLQENVFHGADAVIVNTCGFVDDAKKEAIESILEMAQLKKDGIVRKVLVTGCLSQRYQDEIKNEIPEVDAVLGLGANDDIARHVRTVLAGSQVAEYPALSCLSLGGTRKLISPDHWAYLQIADGCSNCCAYCAIPGIRGPFRSRAMADILAEAELLALQGARELVLIAQDVTAYPGLPELLKTLCLIENIRWIRLLYCYPDEISDELIEVMANESKIVKYMDLPLQHIDDRILKAMGRRGTSADIRNILAKLRKTIPGIAIRTTFIAGFPGEDEQAFEALSAFIEEQRFTRAGVFAFSPQEGTPAYDLPNQVDPEIAQKRAEILTQQQAIIAAQLQQEAIGRVLEVMVEQYEMYTDSYLGRSTADAPEIDGFVVFTGKQNLQAGDIVRVKILNTKEDALLGQIHDGENG